MPASLARRANALHARGKLASTDVVLASVLVLRTTVARAQRSQPPRTVIELVMAGVDGARARQRGSPGRPFLVAASPGSLSHDDLVPERVSLGVLGDPHVNVHVCGTDLYLRVCRCFEIAEPLRIPFGPAAGA